MRVRKARKEIEERDRMRERKREGVIGEDNRRKVDNAERHALHCDVMVCTATVTIKRTVKVITTEHRLSLVKIRIIMTTIMRMTVIMTIKRIGNKTMMQIKSMHLVQILNFLRAQSVYVCCVSRAKMSKVLHSLKEKGMRERERRIGREKGREREKEKSEEDREDRKSERGR